MTDRLTLFAWLLAFANLTHQTTYARWSLGGDPLGAVLLVAAVALLLRPASVGLLIALSALRVAYCAIDLPFLHNHILLEGFVCVAVLAGLAPPLLRRRRLAGFEPAERDALFESFAGFVRLAVLLVYALAFLHKLNSDFFDPGIGCGAHFLVWASERYPFVPTSDAARAAAGIVAVVVEGGIPLLLLFRPTRSAGIALGLGFHTALGLHPVGIYSFSALMAAMLFCWTPPGFPAAVADTGRRFRRRFDFLSTRSLVLGGGGVAAALAAVLVAWKGATPAKSLYAVGLALWFSGTCTIAALYLGTLRSVRIAEPSAAELLRRIGPTHWALTLLLMVNGLSPYLGLKTRTSLTMHSSLRTEGAGWNHLFLPPSLKVFGYQDDLVEILDSSLPKLIAMKHAEQALPFFEFRRRCRDEPGDFHVLYRRNGEVFRFEKREGEGSDPALMERPAWIVERLLYFNEVDTGPQQSCRYG